MATPRNEHKGKPKRRNTGKTVLVIALAALWLIFGFFDAADFVSDDPTFTGIKSYSAAMYIPLFALFALFSAIAYWLTGGKKARHRSERKGKDDRLYALCFFAAVVVTWLIFGYRDLELLMSGEKRYEDIGYRSALLGLPTLGAITLLYWFGSWIADYFFTEGEIVVIRKKKS